MALDPFSGVFTAKQIVTLAERKANNPGLYLTPNGVEPGSTSYVVNPLVDAPAYASLQAILDHLATTQTFTWARTAIDFNITGRINDLPTLNNGSTVSFWRIGFSDPAWIVDPQDSANKRTRFIFLDAQEFHGRFEDGMVGMPEIGYINRAAGTLIVDPAPNKPYLLELHCYPWQAALATVDSRPWFPDSQYLVNTLLCDLYLTADDQRWQIANGERMRLMKDVKLAMGDERDRASAQLSLDSRIYSQPMEL